MKISQRSYINGISKKADSDRSDCSKKITFYIKYDGVDENSTVVNSQCYYDTINVNDRNGRLLSYKIGRSNGRANSKRISC